MCIRDRLRQRGILLSAAAPTAGSHTIRSVPVSYTHLDVYKRQGLTGMGFWGVPLGAVFGLLGDLILKSGGYKSAKKSLLGYAVFSLWICLLYTSRCV